MAAATLRGVETRRFSPAVGVDRILTCCATIVSGAKIQAAATYAVTVRCAYRKLLLTPFAAQLHAWILYFLAEAVRRTGAILHHVTIEPNHIHVVVTVTIMNLPTFKRVFHGHVGKFVKKALVRHGFEAPDRVFGDDRSHQMRLVNAAAQLRFLHYADIQVVKDGLVEKVEHYPGFSSDPGMMAGASKTLARPPFGLNERLWPVSSELRFGITPGLKRLIGTERAIYLLRKARADAERTYAQARTRPVLGAARILAQHPWSEPAAPRKERSGRPPTYMVVDDDELEELCAREEAAFGEAHEAARKRRLAGEDVKFPAGTYLMAVQHGARVEAPAEDAVLSVWETFDDVPELLSPEAREKIASALREAARTVDEDALADDLATRLLATEGVTVDRRDSLDARGEAGRPKKVVTLRSAERARPTTPRTRPTRDERSDDEPPDPTTDN